MGPMTLFRRVLTVLASAPKCSDLSVYICGDPGTERVTVQLRRVVDGRMMCSQWSIGVWEASLFRGDIDEMISRRLSDAADRLDADP